MIFSWEIRGIFIDPRKLNPMQTNSRPKKLHENVPFYLHYWISMKLGANSVTKMTIWLLFLLLSSTVHEIREKSEIQIRKKFVSRNSKIQTPTKSWCHTVLLLTNYFIWKRSYQNNRLAKQEHTATVSYLILGCVSNNHPVVLGSEILSHMKSIKRYITNFGYKLT